MSSSLYDHLSASRVGWILHPQTISASNIIAMLLTYPVLSTHPLLMVSSDSSSIEKSLGRKIPNNIICDYDVNQILTKVSTNTFIFIESVEQLISSNTVSDLSRLLNINVHLIIPITATTPRSTFDKLNIPPSVILSVHPFNPGPDLIYKLNVIKDNSSLIPLIHSLTHLMYDSKHLLVTSNPSLSGLDRPNLTVIDPSELSSTSFEPNLSAIHIVDPLSSVDYDRLMTQIYDRRNYNIDLEPGINPVLEVKVFFYVNTSEETDTNIRISTSQWYNNMVSTISERQNNFMEWEKQAKNIKFSPESGLVVI